MNNTLEKLFNYMVNDEEVKKIFDLDVRDEYKKPVLNYNAYFIKEFYSVTKETISSSDDGYNIEILKLNRRYTHKDKEFIINNSFKKFSDLLFKDENFLKLWNGANSIFDEV